jgi:hypothetical protein
LSKAGTVRARIRLFAKPGFLDPVESVRKRCDWGHSSGSLKFYFFEIFHDESQPSVYTHSAVIPESRPMSAQSKLNILLKWFDDNEIEWKKDLIQVKDVNNSLGVFAKTNIEEGLPGKLTPWNQLNRLNDSH